MVSLYKGPLNIHGRHLTIVEYRGGGRRKLIIIPEEVDDKGWRKMAIELRAMHVREGKNVEKEQRGVAILNQHHSTKITLIETKIFEILFDGSCALCIIEHGRKVTSEFVLINQITEEKRNVELID